MQKTIDIPIVGAPQKLAYQFFELRLNDWLVLIAGLLGAVIANKYLSLPGMIAVLVLTGYVLFPLINDRRYVVWIMRLYGKLWLSGVLRGQLWPVDPEQMSGWRKLVVRMFIPPNAYPFQVDRLFNIGLNYNRSKLTDSVVVVGGGSRFASLSPAADSVSVTGASTHVALTGVDTGTNLVGANTSVSLTGSSTTTSLVGQQTEVSVTGVSNRVNVVGQSTTVSVTGDSMDISMSGDSTSVAIKGSTLDVVDTASSLSLHITASSLVLEVPGLKLEIQDLSMYL